MALGGKFLVWLKSKTGHNERGKKERSVVMITRKTEVRERVSVSLKGQGGRGNCRHGKMMQIQAKKTYFNLWNIYFGFWNSLRYGRIELPPKNNGKIWTKFARGFGGVSVTCEFPRNFAFYLEFPFSRLLSGIDYVHRRASSLTFFFL